MKTPEQMAKEYGDYFAPGEDNKAYTSVIKEIAFLAGYQVAKDQLADVSKLIKPTDTVGKEELKCMIAHFENEDYKISVMVPGILPKDDGGELVCGVGLIVYDIRKKVV